MYLKWLSVSFFLFVNLLWAQSEKVGAVEVRDNEMELFREILNREIALRQDLYDLLAMQFLNFAEFKDQKARNEALKNRGITIKDNTNEPLSRGELARAILESYNFERGLLFTLTKLEFYALRDLQHLGLMEGKYTFHQQLTGRQLVSIINLAEEFWQKIENYEKIDVTR